MLKRLNNLLKNIADFAGHSFSDSTVIECIDVYSISLVGAVYQPAVYKAGSEPARKELIVFSEFFGARNSVLEGLRIPFVRR